MDRVKEFIRMPAGSQRPGFRLSIAYHAGYEKVGIIESGAIGVGQGISQLAASLIEPGFPEPRDWNTPERKLGKERFFRSSWDTLG
jgi:hypothetical protein